jgi:hypothetical protein
MIRTVSIPLERIGPSMERLRRKAVVVDVGESAQPICVAHPEIVKS